MVLLLRAESAGPISTLSSLPAVQSCPVLCSCQPGRAPPVPPVRGAVLLSSGGREIYTVMRKVENTISGGHFYLVLVLLYLIVNVYVLRSM